MQTTPASADQRTPNTQSTRKYWNSFLFSSHVKGTVSRDGFGFWWHAWSVLGLKRGRARCSNAFITQKVYFSRLMRVCVGLVMLERVYLVQVSLFLIGQRGLGHFFRYQPLFPIGWRIVQILSKHRRKTNNTTPTTLSEVQAASQSIFINAPLYLLSQCNLALTTRNTLFAL